MQTLRVFPFTYNYFFIECGVSIEEIAAKDVPNGKTFKIVDVADVPVDRTFRNAWEYAE